MQTTCKSRVAGGGFGRPRAGRMWVRENEKGQQRLEGGWARPTGRSNLLEWPATFRTCFPINFACGKLAGKIANGNHMVTASWNVIIMIWAPKCQNLNTWAQGCCDGWKFEDWLCIHFFKCCCNVEWSHKSRTTYSPLMTRPFSFMPSSRHIVNHTKETRNLGENNSHSTLQWLKIVVLSPL